MAGGMAIVCRRRTGGLGALGGGALVGGLLWGADGMAVVGICGRAVERDGGRAIEGGASGSAGCARFCSRRGPGNAVSSACAQATCTAAGARSLLNAVLHSEAYACDKRLRDLGIVVEVNLHYVCASF